MESVAKAKAGAGLVVGAVLDDAEIGAIDPVGQRGSLAMGHGVRADPQAIPIDEHLGPTICGIYDMYIQIEALITQSGLHKGKRAASSEKTRIRTRTRIGHTHGRRSSHERERRNWGCAERVCRDG